MPPPAPGLGPAVAEHRAPPRDAIGGALAATLIVLAFGAVKNWGNGDGLWPGLTVLLIAVLGGAFIGLPVLGSGTTAGPGWLLRRRLRGSSWVRTDQLVRVRAESITALHFILRDRDGRELFIPWSAVTVSPKLEARVRKDVAISAAAGADLDKRSAQILLGRQR